MEVSVNPHFNRSGTVPAVSIITPAYMVADLIGETLDSVIAQTFQDFEWIVVNDGSPDTDALERALEPVRDRIVYVKQQNKGAAIARNTAIDHARGEYLAFLDGDDIWVPEYLESQLGFLKKYELSMVYCDAKLIGQSDGFGETFMEQAPSNGEVSVSSLLALTTNVITSGTVVFKAAVDKVGRFENARIQAEDFNLWVRIAHAGYRIGYSKNVLLSYRVSSTGFSGGAENRLIRAIDAFQRIECQIDLSASEKAVLHEKIKDFEAELSVVKGKQCLLIGDFREARKAFATARKRRNSLKLLAAELLTRVAPRLAAKVYLKLNPAEVPFVAAR